MRNAFRATLRDEPSATNLVATQELDAADVLEVTDLATAIARAEEVIRARSSHAIISAAPSSSGVRDIFDALVDKSSASSATDDCAGSAQYAPYVPTPVPPARVTPIPLPPIPKAANVAQLTQGKDSADRTQPLAAVGFTPPILVLDEDAFYYPAGRIRGFADVTIEGYRPEPTLLVRIRARRHAFSWIVAALVAVLGLVALFAVAMSIGRAHSTEPSVSAGVTSTPAKPVQTAPIITAAATPTAAPAPTIVASAGPVVPVFDIKNLPVAKTKRR